MSFARVSLPSYEEAEMMYGMEKERDVGIYGQTAVDADRPVVMSNVAASEGSCDSNA
jgi:hypothetical protein